MSFLEVALNISIIMIGISLILIFIRLAIGPTIEDRIVAVYAIQNKTTTFLDVGIIIALLAFLGTVAFAYYLERRTRR